MEQGGSWLHALQGGVNTWGEKKRRPKKRKYSRGVLRVVGIVDRHVVGGMVHGLEVYRKRSDKSSKKRRDGALRDLGKNLARAHRKGTNRMTKAPKALVRTRDFKRPQKNLRRLLLRPLSW